MKYTFTVEEGGKRLDVFLSENISGLTRSQSKNWIEQGFVLVNGVAAKKAGLLLEVGNEIEVHSPETRKLDLVPQKVDIEILFEDDALAVLNKPAGISVHPSQTETSATVVHGLLHELKSLSSVGGVERPGIVHRIDKGTSGILVVSKTDEAHLNLAAQFKAHSIERRYQALVFGDVEKKMKANQGVIETLYGRHPIHRKKMTGKIKPERSIKMRKAITHWKVLGSFNELTLVECRLETGRTHQIRVHLSEMGFPVVGDPLYCDSPRKAKDMKKTELRKFLTTLSHQLLHAYSLEFEHPISHKRMRFESKLPKDFQTALDLAR